jgi:hypothetical protein
LQTAPCVYTSGIGAQSSRLDPTCEQKIVHDVSKFRGLVGKDLYGPAEIVWWLIKASVPQHREVAINDH